jgi:hypothetical protein
MDVIQSLGFFLFAVALIAFFAWVVYLAASK